MTILVDTNVLLRSAQPSHAQHADAAAAIKTLEANGHELVVVPQVLYEFWVVATRSIVQNGLGLAANMAEQELAQIRRIYDILHDDQAVFDAWLTLMTKYGVLGKSAHDARLVAAMLRHGVAHLLTFNMTDFARYAEMTALAPESAATFPPAAPSV